MKGRYTIEFALATLLLFASFPVPAVETTIYVGKHFEVRDYNQPTKYVFNGSTRVARITGSLSTNTRVQRFRLHPGWNLLSLAVSATNLSDQLQSPGVVTSAHSWNAQTGRYLPAPQVASSGMVLWVNATTNATLSITGTYQDPVNRQIAAGAAYLPCTGLEAWSPALPPSVAAWSFSPEPSTLDSQPTWLARLTSDLSTVNELPHVFAPGQAFYVNSPAPFELEIPDPALRVRYYHQDHLGSSSVMTDASGALVAETAFYPFGIPRHKHRVLPIEEPYQFTQKERDRESGLHHFEARYLAGGMSKFLSVDPMYANTDASTGDPQSMNLYAYVRNNPLLYTDPTGLEPAPSLADIAHAAAVSDTKASAGGGYAEFAMGMLENAATFTTGFCDNAFGCGMPGYQVTRSIVVQGYNVDEDSKVFKGGAVAGFVTSLAVPVPPIASLAGKTRTAARAAVGGGESANVAKSVVDPLANTMPSYRPPTYAPVPPPRPKTLPGFGGNNAAAAVSKANQRALGAHEAWNAAVNASPKQAWTQASIDATRSYRLNLPSREQPDALRSIYEAADAIFK